MIGIHGIFSTRSIDKEELQNIFREAKNASIYLKKEIFLEKTAVITLIKKP
jgi:hypothetical protein